MPKLTPMPIPDAKRQVTGRINRAAGLAFEERLDLAFAYYKERGFAIVDKTPEPVKIIRRLDGGRFVACFTKKAQPDYKGTIKGGRSVLYEAKFTRTDRLRQEAVNDVQQDYLTRQTELGARCYVLAGFRTGNVYRVPWPVWAAMDKYFGHKYVTEKDLQPYQVATSWNDRLLILD